MVKLPSPKDDGLYVADVGLWSHDKHYFLARYMDAFTTSMKNKWKELHYIDLFAGPGIERLGESGKLEWGSPLIAAQIRHPFTRLHFCELIQEKYDALKQRISHFQDNVQFLYGDANEKVHDVLKEIPTDALSMAFLDPYGLHLDFETLRSLAQKRVDLIIFFPDYLDVLRNWEQHYLCNPSSNLDRCLGPGANWRETLDQTPQDRFVQVLGELYIQQIKTLGYTEFESERISHKGHPYYKLLFCTRHALALKLWRGISQKQPNGQRMIPFD